MPCQVPRNLTATVGTWATACLALANVECACAAAPAAAAKKRERRKRMLKLSGRPIVASTLEDVRHPIVECLNALP